MVEGHRPGFARRAPRAPLTVTVQHQDEAGGELLADVGENISTSGVFVRCDVTYTVGTKVRLRFPLPEGHIEARGRVVRVGPGASGHTGMGIIFVSLDGPARAQVERLVEGGVAS